MVPNTTYGGPHVTPMSTFQGVPFTSNAAEFNAIKSGSIDVAYVDFDDVPQLPEVLRLGYNYFGDAGLRHDLRQPTTSRTRPATSTTSSPSCTSARRSRTWWTSRAGSPRSCTARARPPTGPIPAYPQSPYLPPTRRPTRTRSASRTAVSMLKSHGWTVVPGGTDTCANAGHRRQRVRGGHPGRHQAGLELHLQLLAGPDRQPGHRLRVEGQAGRHQHHAVRAATSTT